MISKIRASNFMSWSKLDFEVKSGVTLIDGWNEDDQTSEGSGKSSILNALAWALFGKIPKDVNIDDVIREGATSCSVQVLFEDGSEIVRSRKPNDLFLVRDNKQIRGKDAKDTQSLIEQFVGLSFDTFCQTIYFAQNYSKKFLTSNQEEKGKILSEIQDLTAFDLAGKEVRLLIKAEEDSLAKLNHSEQLLTSKIELNAKGQEAEDLKKSNAKLIHTNMVDSTKVDIRNEEAKLELQLESHLTKVKLLKSEKERLEDEIASSETDLAVTEESVESIDLIELDANIKIHENLNSDLSEQMASIRAELSNVTRLETMKTNADRQAKRHVERYKQLQADRKKHTNFVENPVQDCPTCGTELSGCDTSHAINAIAEIDSELAEITQVLTGIAADLETPIPDPEELKADLSKLTKQASEVTEQIAKFRALQTSYSVVQANIKSQKQAISKLTQRLDLVNSELNNIGPKPKQDLSQLNYLKRKLEELSQLPPYDETALNKLKHEALELQEQKAEYCKLQFEKRSYLSQLEELKIGFKEVKSYVFNSVLNEINSRIRSYVSQLFEVPVSLVFKNVDMKIETEIKYDGIERSLGLLSGGQFRRMNLATDLALSDSVVARTGAKLGITIWDEYMKDLSEASMEKVLQLFVTRNKPTLLIEHNSIFKNIVNHSVKAVLRNGISELEVGNV